MKISITDTKEILALLSERIGEPLDRSGLHRIADAIGGTINQRFLYDKLSGINNAKTDSLISFRDSKLSELLGFLGFKNIEDFKQFLKQPISELLNSCEGDWINLVRQNSNSGIVLASPVNITQEGHVMKYVLEGPAYKYEGEIVDKNGSLFAHFEAEMGKQFHHVYKIGTRIAPDILQGVFSGVSTSNEPIAGRTLLIKKSFIKSKSLQGSYRIENLLKSESELDKAIGNYFEKYAVNNIRINPVLTFGIEDLT